MKENDIQLQIWPVYVVHTCWNHMHSCWRVVLVDHSLFSDKATPDSTAAAETDIQAYAA